MTTSGDARRAAGRRAGLPRAGLSWARLPRAGLPRPGLPRAGLWRAGTGRHVAIAMIAAAIVTGGCAAVPTSGAVQQVGGASQPGSGQEQDYSQPIAVGPGPGWSAAQIVAGFLAANASFANDHAVAREYLDAAAQRVWRPGWAVTVVSSWQVSPVNFPRQVVSEPSGYNRVQVTGLRVATLTDTGQSLVTSGSPKQTDTFSLREINGQWRINTLPPDLLLTQSDFQHVYQPRNLYFLAGSGKTLVPDPVFVPQQDTNTELAKGLVTALLDEPKGWLGGAAATGFPAGTKLIGDVKINGPNAVVDLGGKAATASRRQQEQMAAQLAWTLASVPSAIQSVEMEVNGRPLQIAGSQLQLPQTYHAWVPTVSAASSLYFIGSNKTVRAMSGIGETGSGEPSVTAVPGAAGAVGVPSLTSIAVSPDGRSIAGIGAGGKVYIGSLSHGAVLREAWHAESGVCTSLSWDRYGDLWITAGGNVWMLAPGQPGASQIALPPTDTATAFRVAPDGVRAVMIVNGTQLQLVAITRSGSSATLGDPVAIGTGISDPRALSWYDANYVIVLSGSSSGSQLEKVPLNGGQPSQIAGDGDIMSVAAMSPGGSSPDIAVGLSNGHIMVASNQGAFEDTHATGEAPVFPG
jgi:hypothetical protein